MEVPMRRTSCVLLLAAVCGCGDESRVTQPRDISQSREAHTQPTTSARYVVRKLSASLGGTVSVGTSINAQGWVAGFSNQSGDLTRHATLWRHGSITDLGTLGGPNSSVQWPGLNNRGVIVGIAELARSDPLNEEWSCSAFFPTVTGHICRGFVWERGVMRRLPTLGGNNNFATTVNGQGQVVGWAETRVHDPTCNSPQVLQFRAVMWEPRSGRFRAKELPPLRGDSTSAATAINNHGLAAGISGECDVAVGRFSARHAVIWENGKPRDIGNLGGVSWHTPMALNERGDVVGFSNPPGDEDGNFLPHAFIWTRERGIKDLGLIRGDDYSQAFAINDKRVVVGRSCGAAGCRAVIWQNGVLTDLNRLVGPGFPDVLLAARDIKDDGTITGNLLEQSTGKILVFVASPK
jgi:probable HAF family extracellular repeat protein